MSVITKMINDWSKFLKAQIELIKTTNDKEFDEIKKLEGKLKKLEKSDKKSAEKNVWDVRGMFKFWLIWLLIVFVWYLGFQSLTIIYLILTAFILSIAMEAIINLFERIKLKRWLAIAIAYIFLIIFIIPWLFLVWLFLLDLLSQFLQKIIWRVSDLKIFLDNNTLNSLVNWLEIPESFKNLILKNLNPEAFQKLVDQVQQNIAQIVWTWTEYAKNIFNFVWNFSWSIITKLSNIFLNLWLVLTLSVLFSTQKASVVDFLSWLGGKKRKDYLKIKFERIYKKLWLWLKWQLILCACIFSVTLVALYILKLCWFDIPNVWSLSTIAWLTEIIPYIGPILGWIPTIFTVLLHNWLYPALLMLLVIFAIQWLENNILIPFIMNKTLWVNPITIFISMIIWWLIMWFVWIFLAVPIAVIITMFIGNDE